MKNHLLAVVNPAAGGGRCGKLAKATLDSLRRTGIEFDVVETKHPGEGIELVREAHDSGYRNFLAVGGDGTSFEVLNGLFPRRENDGVALGLLPLGTGNSFWKDFASPSAEETAQAVLRDRRRKCDVLRLVHTKGEIYFINLLTVGFAADVAALTNRRFKRLGRFGYLLGVLACLARLDRRAFPLRLDHGSEVDRRRCLFLAFTNTKFTGGNMMIAPEARPDDGLIEYVRWGPIGRLGLLRNLRTLFDGTHIHHPLASHTSVRQIDFVLDGPVTVMVDGESLSLECRRIEVLPAALSVFV